MDTKGDRTIITGVKNMPAMHKITLYPGGEEAALPSYQCFPAQRKLIVVIDDSQTVRKIVQVCLSREGFEVVGFPDGIEALRWLTQPGARLPHLVILDIGLPKMDGYEVARYLKRKPQFHHTVMIMLSRRAGIVDRLKGRLAGAQDYLTKPFKTQDLISIIETHLRGNEQPDDE